MIFLRRRRGNIGRRKPQYSIPWNKEVGKKARDGSKKDTSPVVLRVMVW
jgi:hypothetical protein